MNVEHPLATSIVETCFKCEQRMPGYANSFIQRLCSFSGRKGCEPHYDQLLQHLAELIVIAHLAEKIDESWIFPHISYFSDTKNLFQHHSL